MEGFHGAQGGAPTCDGNLRTLADEAAQGHGAQLGAPGRAPVHAFAAPVFAPGQAQSPSPHLPAGLPALRQVPGAPQVAFQAPAAATRGVYHPHPLPAGGCSPLLGAGLAPVDATAVPVVATTGGNGEQHEAHEPEHGAAAEPGAAAAVEARLKAARSITPDNPWTIENEKVTEWDYRDGLPKPLALSMKEEVIRRVPERRPAAWSILALVKFLRKFYREPSIDCVHHQPYA